MTVDVAPADRAALYDELAAWLEERSRILVEAMVLYRNDALTPARRNEVTRNTLSARRLRRLSKEIA